VPDRPTAPVPAPLHLSLPTIINIAHIPSTSLIMGFVWRVRCVTVLCR
jgi:hypothetical protein